MVENKVTSVFQRSAHLIRKGQPAKPSILEIKSKVATDLDVVSVNIDVLVGVVEDRPRARVSRVARHVVGHHQNDLYTAWLKLQNDI